MINHEEKGSGTPDFTQHISALVFLFIRNRLIWLDVKATKTFLPSCSFLVLTYLFFLMLQGCHMSCVTTTWFWPRSPKMTCPRPAKSCALPQDPLGVVLPLTLLMLQRLWSALSIRSLGFSCPGISCCICCSSVPRHLCLQPAAPQLLCRCQKRLLPLCKAVWLEKLVCSFCSLELQLYAGTGELRSSSLSMPLPGP